MLDQAIRTKIIDFEEELICLHLDAHGDLSVPSIPSVNITMEDMDNPKKVLDILEASTGGIAEFLPLLIPKHLKQ